MTNTSWDYPLRINLAGTSQLLQGLPPARCLVRGLAETEEGLFVLLAICERRALACRSMPGSCLPRLLTSLLPDLHSWLVFYFVSITPPHRSSCLPRTNSAHPRDGSPGRGAACTPCSRADRASPPPALVSGCARAGCTGARVCSADVPAPGAELRSSPRRGELFQVFPLKKARQLSPACAGAREGGGAGRVPGLMAPAA